MTEDKNDNDANIPETRVPATILTPMGKPMSAIADEESPYVNAKSSWFTQRISNFFSWIFSGW